MSSGALFTCWTLGCRMAIKFRSGTVELVRESLLGTLRIIHLLFPSFSILVRNISRRNIMSFLTTISAQLPLCALWPNATLDSSNYSRLQNILSRSQMPVIWICRKSGCLRKRSLRLSNARLLLRCLCKYPLLNLRRLPQQPYLSVERELCRALPPLTPLFPLVRLRRKSQQLLRLPPLSPRLRLARLPRLRLQCQREFLQRQHHQFQREVLPW